MGENFTKRFGKFPDNELSWIRENEQLIDVSSDETLRIQFKSQTCQKFWLSIRKKICRFEEKGNKYFDSVCINLINSCECFSKLVTIKIKYRSRLDADLRLTISNRDLHIETILSSLQVYTSH